MKENLLEFYVNKFCFSNSLENIDISFIPSILRRRTSNIDKVAIDLMNKTYSEKVESVVFSSRFGEFERLLKIINQYTLAKEASPNLFSASVHNYPVSFFLSNKLKSIPYIALAGYKDTISSGLSASIASNYGNVLFCYCDVETKEDEDKITGFSLNITKNPTKTADKYYMKVNSNPLKVDNFDDFKDFFLKKTNKLETSLFVLERAE